MGEPSWTRDRALWGSQRSFPGRVTGSFPVVQCRGAVPGLACVREPAGHWGGDTEGAYGGDSLWAAGVGCLTPRKLTVR